MAYFTTSHCGKIFFFFCEFFKKVCSFSLIYLWCWPLLFLFWVPCLTIRDVRERDNRKEKTIKLPTNQLFAERDTVYFMLASVAFFHLMVLAWSIDFALAFIWHRFVGISGGESRRGALATTLQARQQLYLAVCTTLQIITSAQSLLIAGGRCPYTGKAASAIDSSVFIHPPLESTVTRGDPYVQSISDATYFGAYFVMVFALSDALFPPPRDVALEDQLNADCVAIAALPRDVVLASLASHPIVQQLERSELMRMQKQQHQHEKKLAAGTDARADDDFHAADDGMYRRSSVALSVQLARQTLRSGDNSWAANAMGVVFRASASQSRGDDVVYESGKTTHSIKTTD